MQWEGESINQNKWNVNIIMIHCIIYTALIAINHSACACNREPNASPETNLTDKRECDPFSEA